MDTNKFMQFWNEIHGPERWEVAVRVLIIWVFALLIFLFLHRWLPMIISKRHGGNKKRHWMEVIAQNKLLTKLGIVILVATLSAMLPLINWEGVTALRKVISILFIAMATIFIASLMRTANGIYEGFPIAKSRPIKLFVQTAEVLLYCVGIIFIISVIVSKTPHNLFVGLGAFAAVVMLIFKDSITGFVAGIQLNANDMVRLGDWIVVENCSANGVVEEINLYTVKVRNWDMTLSMVPTYQLVSVPFINWRGMFDSEGRRIMQNVYVDARSVHFVSEEELLKIRNSIYLKEFIEKKLLELEAQKAEEKSVLDVNSLTNLTLFRHYMEAWMSANAKLNVRMLCMVRELPSSPTGIPLQFYCFTKDKQWVEHEHIIADMFDHIYAVLSEFSLHVYEYSHPSWE